MVEKSAYGVPYTVTVDDVRAKVEAGELTTLTRMVESSVTGSVMFDSAALNMALDALNETEDIAE